MASRDFVALWVGDEPALHLYGVHQTEDGLRGELACAMQPLPVDIELMDDDDRYVLDEEIGEGLVYELLRDVRVSRGDETPAT